MKHTASGRFWALYDALPKAVRAVADKNFQLLKSDPRHPSLHFKRLGKLWSVRVGEHHRALGHALDSIRSMGETEGIVAIDIDKLTEAELVDLNNRIVERLRFLAQARAHTRMLRFKIGDPKFPVPGMSSR